MNVNHIDDYNWDAVWEHADPRFTDANALGQPESAHCVFSRDDIKTVHAAVYEDNGDGADMYAVVELNDGRWAALESWHDYTGWD